VKIFLSLKYHADHANRERIEAITRVLDQCGFKTLCIARDVERWGKLHFDDAELMRRTFAEIDASGLVVVDLTEKGVGVGIEAGYAHAKGIPIVVIAQRGADISTTMRGISRAVIFYDDLEKLDEALMGIENYAR
jgi:nucleoside 2-deoxyribosyltransferase